MKKEVKLALCQVESRNGDKPYNLNKALEIIESAAKQGANIVVFPETYYTGYYNTKKEFFELAETSDGDLFRSMSKACKSLGLCVIIGYVEKKKDDKSIYNSLMFIDNYGKLATSYTKFYSWAQERKIFPNGNKLPVIETDFGKIGLLLCYDIEFPETSRILAFKGADIIICCSVWREFIQQRWYGALLSIAMANLVFVAGCNTVGINPDGEKLCGDTQLIDPMGEIPHRSGDEEVILYADLDIGKIASIRNNYPIYDDFKSDTFDRSLLNKY